MINRTEISDNKTTLLLIVLLGVTAYIPSLFFDTFFIDDHALIFNKFKGSFNIFDSLTPVADLIWMTIYKFSPQSPIPYRSLNIILHLLNTTLIFLISKKYFQKYLNDNQSLLASIIYLLSPVQVESVVWLSSLKGTISSSFIIASFYFYLGKRNIIAFLLFFTLSLLSKAGGVTLPFVLVFISIIKNEKINNRKNALSLLIILIISAVYILKFESLGSSEIVLPIRLLKVISGVQLYFKNILIPFNLGINYNLNSFSPIIINHHPIFYALLIVLIIRFLKNKKDPSVILFIVTLILLLPFMGFLHHGYQSISFVADRYWNMALIPFSFSLALLLKRPSKKAIVLISLFLLITTMSQVQKWKGGETLLQSSSSKDRTGLFTLLKAHNFRHRGRINQSKQAFKEAMKYGYTKTRAIKGIVEIHKEFGNNTLNHLLRDNLISPGTIIDQDSLKVLISEAYKGNHKVFLANFCHEYLEIPKIDKSFCLKPIQ